MATFLLAQSLPFTFPVRASFKTPHFSNSPAIRFAEDACHHRKARGSTMVTRAGPSTNSYIFAFALPLSLLAITIVASLRIGERLDREFLEETSYEYQMAMNEAIMEADEDDDDDDIEPYKQDEPALTRARNRPKREA